MPAALPALTPLGASSKTRQVEGSGLGLNLSAAYRKMSGAGLPFVIRSPAEAPSHVAALVLGTHSRCQNKAALQPSSL